MMKREIVIGETYAVDRYNVGGAPFKVNPSRAIVLGEPRKEGGGRPIWWPCAVEDQRGDVATWEPVEIPSTGIIRTWADHQGRLHRRQEQNAKLARRRKRDLAIEQGLLDDGLRDLLDQVEATEKVHPFDGQTAVTMTITQLGRLLELSRGDVGN